ncbi:hypothetical protein [Streptomyces sp. NPDC050560]|uniref:hypothetical protein n=1 Tax=Streptomyces sp. NPDC050560 TaxID=3365630 RepID=UPI0037ADF840
MDAFDAGSVRAALPGAAPDVVVHRLTALAEFDTAANPRARATGWAPAHPGWRTGFRSTDR